MNDLIKPYTIAVEQCQVDDLKRRLEFTRWPDPESVSDWSQGVPLAYMQELSEYWLHEYDWRIWEQRLNNWGQFITCIDNVDIQFMHIRSPHADAMPLLITHGWPGSMTEFHKIIEPLTNPTAHGGQSEDAFHLVLPTLPGYGFSGKPALSGWGVDKIGRAWAELMARLGYDSYVAQGGDWGAMVTQSIAQTDTTHCAGIHVTFPIVAPDPATMDDLQDIEIRALAAMTHYDRWDSGYAKQQSTRPQTLGYGLSDSPVGQAAWIVEKFWSWMDCGETDGHPENILTRDELLDNIS
ncbi:MAG: pimeloyl-ACP methyl ester carboxylesterase, partial [Halieaceae bacterium]